jgi:hypothetical protein
MSEYGCVCCGHWEWDFRKGRVEGFDANDGVPLLREAECAQKALHLDVWVGGPNANVVTVLVCYARPFDVELHMNTAAIIGILEQLAGDGNGRSVWVLRVMNAFGSSEGTSRQLA